MGIVMNMGSCEIECDSMELADSNHSQRLFVSQIAPFSACIPDLSSLRQLLLWRCANPFGANSQTG